MESISNQMLKKLMELLLLILKKEFKDILIKFKQILLLLLM